jgi:hypothetical protein
LFSFIDGRARSKKVQVRIIVRLRRSTPTEIDLWLGRDEKRAIEGKKKKGKEIRSCEVNSEQKRKEVLI